MIEINLLPEELRLREKGFEVSKELAILIGVSALLILASLYFLLAGWVVSQEQSLKKWLAEKSQLEIPLKEVTQLKQEIQALQDHFQKAEKILSRSFLWSKKLNQISDLLVSGIWLTELTLQKKTLTQGGTVVSTESALIISGRAYSKSHEETALVGRYLSVLKSDQDFFQHFKDIQVENIQGIKLGEVLVAKFSLVCPMKLEETEISQKAAKGGKE